jgi:putative peptidoglycan lipid II flippase
LIASNDVGSISYLHYAERIFFLPLTLIAVSISTVLIPNLSSALRQSNRALALNSQSKAFKFCLVLTLPITFGLIVLSNDIIEILYQRGEFTHEATLNVSLCLKYFLVGLPFAALAKILTPYFFATEKPKIPLIISLFTVAINLTLVIFLFKYLGFIGIPISLSISAFFNLILILIQHRKENFFFLDKKLILYAFKCLLLSIILTSILLILDFFQITTYVLFVDLLMKIFLVSILWSCAIYFFDKDIISLIKK